MQGIIPDLPHREYHAMTEIVSNSYLKKLSTVPAAAKIPYVDTESKLIGRAFHCLMLDTKATFDSLFAIRPEINLRTDAGKKEMEVFKYFNEGKDVLTIDQFNLLQEMMNAVITHPTACTLLTRGVSEQSIFWTDEETGLHCKCRPDRIPDGDHGVILCLKSTKNASKHAFRNDVINLGYYTGAAFYLDGYNIASGKKADSYIFIAVEKKPPYRTEVYVMPDDFIGAGRIEYRRLLHIEKACREGGYWPHFLTADIQELECPNYL